MFNFHKLVGEGTITSKLKWLIVGLALLAKNYPSPFQSPYEWQWSE